MGVPGFYSWLTKRYPMIKQMVGKHSLPQIDYLYLDMNGIIYKCVKDDSIIFKSQVMPKQLEEIWIQIFNYINHIVNLLKPSKMIVMALDGVAPRSKMNNQRARRFKSSRDYKEYIQKFYGYSETVESQQNFKNNSISPGTKFMEDLNEMLHFFIQKKIQQDDYWKNLSIVFTGSDCPGEGQHKIMQFIRSNKHQFDQNDCHCLYGADADLIMLGLSLPLKNLCIIRQQYTHQSEKVKIMTSKKEKTVQFEMIFLTILREYFDIEYQQIKESMKNLNYSITKIIKDFVFLFFFIGNDFLPRCMAYNIRQKSIEKLIKAFKQFLTEAQDYVVGQKEINMKELARLCNQVAKYQAEFIEDKAEQAQKFLQKKVEFQDEFNQIMKQKVFKETQFLNQLKQFYLNQDQNIRAGFYRAKFNIDPAHNIQQFYSLLGFYLHGLKFVYQYYFLSLSSWSWYYPYYYAPLLSDLSFYLNYLAENNQKLHDLELGQPFQPFKQLLCILPKQSNQLLPVSFREYLKDQNSPLRSPIDFYPDHFQDDLYGSIRSHEAVSLIPFLNQQIIERVYQQASKKVTPEQQRRNVFHKTRLYQYQEEVKQIQVTSPFQHIQSFSCNIKIQDINLLEPTTWIHKNPVTKDINVLKMPTLSMKNIQSYFDDKKGLTYYIKVVEEQIKDLKIGQYIFYGYPLEHSGRIQAILSFQSFKYIAQFDPYAYKLDHINASYEDPRVIQAQKRKQLFQDLLHQFKKKYSFLDLRNTGQIAFIIDTQYFSRTLDGGFERVFQTLNAVKTYEILPVSLLSRTRNYVTTKQNFHFSSIKQEFPLNQEVIFIHPKEQISGSKGKVVGYSNDQKRVKVKLTQPLKKYKSQNLMTIVNTNEVFLDIRFVSQLIKIKYDILLTIIDSVSVELPREKNLPPQIDIGLNFISRHQNKLVPGLVRLNFESKQVKDNSKGRFKYLQMSIRAFQILLEYKTKYPEVLQFIKLRHFKLVQNAKMNNQPINWRQKIKAEDIYRDDGKSQGKHNQTTKQLMKVYVWLIKKEETHLPVSSIYSKQISFKKIEKLQEYFLAERQKRKNKKQKFQESIQQQIDPNYLYSLSLAKKGTIYLAQRPAQHAIGDQIICIHPEYFGHFGVVTGIDDDKYEVIFEKPSFGKTNLAGLCENLWGGKFKYKQIFNLQIWLKHFRQRTKPKSLKQNLGWIESQAEYYPKFKTNPIKNFNDFQKFLNNVSNAKFFTQQIIQYIRKVKDDLKMVEIDPDYQVVDNRQQDYKYKFDNKQATVSTAEVQEISKNKKWVQKKIEVTEKVQDFEQEVIENKLQKLQISDKKDQEFGQEQDAGDILA